MGVVEFFNTKYHNYRQMLLKPKDAARKQMRNLELGSGIRTLTVFLFLAGLVGVILFGIGNILQSLVFLAFGGTMSGLVGAVVTAFIAFIIYLLAFIPAYLLWLISMLIGVAIIWGIAKLFSGKSAYGKQFGALAEPIAAIAFITSTLGGLFYILTSIITPISGMASSILNAILGIPLLLLELYGVWIEIIYTAEANEFTLWKAAVSVLLPIFLAILVVVVIVVILIALFSITAFTSLAGALPV